MMKPCDRLTILRNRFRARDLRLFRYHVRSYVELLEDDAAGQPVDWDRVRSTRADVNRRLARVMEMVEAGGLDGTGLRGIFDERAGEGRHQEILDLIDMAIGVYDAGVGAALGRTVNPFHYVFSALGFLAGLPRRALVALGILGPRPAPRPGGVGPDPALSQLIETRFAELREAQARLFAQHGDQMEDLAQRMDFLERMLAQQRPAARLGKGGGEGG